jgi:hypothetical protein
LPAGAAHGLHVALLAAPIVSEYEPAGQEEHSVAPEPEYLPCTQSEQEALLAAAHEPENLPDLQSRQVELLVAFLVSE